MPLTQATAYPLYEGALVSAGSLGVGRPRLAAALAEGLSQYVRLGVTAISIDTGSAGAGKGTGVGVFLPQPVLEPALLASMAGHLILGPFAPALATGIALGTVTSLAQALLSGVHPGVGAGAGVLRVIPNGSGALLYEAAFRLSGVSGLMGSALAQSVALALDTSMASAAGALAIAGPGSPMAGGGIGQVSIS